MRLPLWTLPQWLSLYGYKGSIFQLQGLQCYMDFRLQACCSLLLLIQTYVPCWTTHTHWVTFLKFPYSDSRIELRDKRGPVCVLTFSTNTRQLTRLVFGVLILKWPARRAMPFVPVLTSTSGKKRETRESNRTPVKGNQVCSGIKWTRYSLFFFIPSLTHPLILTSCWEKIMILTYFKKVIEYVWFYEVL